MLFIEMLILFFAISNRVAVYPEMLFIAMLFLAFLVAIFNKYKGRFVQRDTPKKKT